MTQGQRLIQPVCAWMCVVRTRERYQQVRVSPYLPLKNREVCLLCINVHFRLARRRKRQQSQERKHDQSECGTKVPTNLVVFVDGATLTIKLTWSSFQCTDSIFLVQPEAGTQVFGSLLCFCHSRIKIKKLRRLWANLKRNREQSILSCFDTSSASTYSIWRAAFLCGEKRNFVRAPML